MTIDGKYKKTINRWSELLLDTAKNNNLISIKDNGSSCLKILFTDIIDLFVGFRSGKTFGIYDPNVYDESKKLRESLANEKGFLNYYRELIKNDLTILPYHTKRKPLTVFKNITKKAKSYHDEAGINILYASLGSIYLKENKKTGNRVLCSDPACFD